MRLLTKTAGAAIVAAAFGLMSGSAAHAVTTSQLTVPVELNSTIGPVTQGTPGAGSASITDPTPFNFDYYIPQWGSTTVNAAINLDCSQNGGSNNCSLTGVEFVINGSVTGTITYTNPPGGATGTISGPDLKGEVTANNPFGGPLLDQANAKFTCSDPNLAPYCTGNNATLPGNTTVTTNAVTATVTYDSGVVGIGLSNFIGGGYYDNLGSLLDFTDCSQNASISCTPNNINGTVGSTVQYLYNDLPPTVPEPTSLALLGSGLVGLGAMVRRRRRSS